MQIDVLTQCQKYGFVRLKQDLDRKLANSIDASTQAIQAQTDAHHKVSGRTVEYIFVDYNDTMFRPVRQFDLPLSEESLVNYLVNVLEQNNHRLELRREHQMKLKSKVLNSANSRVREFVERMRNDGHYRMCALFAQRIMEAGISFSPV